MEFVLPSPASTGAWLALVSGLAAAGIGACLVLIPLFIRLQGSFPQLCAALAGGFALGLGLSSILLDQPMLHIALGAAWAMTAMALCLGLPRGAWRRPGHWLAAIAAAGFAAAPMAYVFGHIP
jgi:hypothetical protein